jgi:hypothetical protein
MSGSHLTPIDPSDPPPTKPSGPPPEPSGPPQQRPSLTVSEAAERTGTSRSTVRRRLDGGELPSAWRETGPDGGPSGPWRIPVDDLLAAGFDLSAPSREQATPNAGEPVEPAGPAGDADARELAELRAQLDRARAEAERWRAVADERQAALDRADTALRAVTAALPAGEPAEAHEPAESAPGGPAGEHHERDERRGWPALLARHRWRRGQ